MIEVFALSMIIYAITAGLVVGICKHLGVYESEACVVMLVLFFVIMIMMGDKRVKRND